MSHTPGPWITNGYSSPISGTITVYHKPFGLGDVAEVHDINDARLIATAPELLQALEQMAEMWVSVCNSRGWEPEHMARYVKARAAIKKARGEA